MYKVIWLQDNIYQVVIVDREDIVKYQGSLADCNAWLQLNDKGYFK